MIPELNYPSEHYKQAAEEALTGFSATEPWMGQALYALARATESRHICEVGVYTGITTIWLALAAQQTGGCLIAIDHNADYLDKTRARLEAAGLLGSVELVQGDAVSTLHNRTELFDFVYLDADHSYDGLERIFRAAWLQTRDKGLMCLHDTNYFPTCAENEWLALHFPHAVRLLGGCGPTPHGMMPKGVGLIQVVK